MNKDNSVEYYVKKIFKEIKYGDHPYFFHLEKAVLVLKEEMYVHPSYSMIEKCVWLHDAIEDASETRDSIEARFGGHIADIVDRVTDGVGKNRSERHLNTYFKIRENELAVIVKLCDRIANIEYSKENSSDKYNMYKKESKCFKSGIYDPRHKYAKKLWKRYDNAFQKEVLK